MFQLKLELCVCNNVIHAHNTHVRLLFESLSRCLVPRPVCGSHHKKTEIVWKINLPVCATFLMVCLNAQIIESRTSLNWGCGISSNAGKQWFTTAWKVNFHVIKLELCIPSKYNLFYYFEKNYYLSASPKRRLKVRLHRTWRNTNQPKWDVIDNLHKVATDKILIIWAFRAFKFYCFYYGNLFFLHVFFVLQPKCSHSQYYHFPWQKSIIVMKAKLRCFFIDFFTNRGKVRFAPHKKNLFRVAIFNNFNLYARLKIILISKNFSAKRAPKV